MGELGQQQQQRQQCKERNSEQQPEREKELEKRHDQEYKSRTESQQVRISSFRQPGLDTLNPHQHVRPHWESATATTMKSAAPSKRSMRTVDSVSCMPIPEPLPQPVLDPSLAPPRRAWESPSAHQIRMRVRRDQTTWVAALRELLRLTRALGTEPVVGSRPDEIVVMLPHTTIADFIGDLGESKWYVQTPGSTDSCLVHVLPGGAVEDGCSRKVVLSGSMTARAIAAHHLHTLAAQTPLKGSDGGRVKIRLVCAPSRLWPRAGQPQRADEVPPPETWTTKSFANYVETLTTLAMPHSTHRLLYRRGERHAHIVRNLLFQLFDNPTLTPFLSTRAINLLIVYLDRHGFFPVLRALFWRLEPLLTTRSANTLLRVAASKGDLRMFRQIVRVMSGISESGGTRLIPPNGLTWVALATAVRPPRVREAVVAIMRELGVLDSTFYLQSAMPAIIKYDLKAHMARGGDISTFVALTSRRFGGNVDDHRWLCTTAVREMVRVARQQRNTPALEAIWALVHQHGMRPDAWTVKEMLRHYADIGDLRSGMEFFFRAPLQLHGDSAGIAAPSDANTLDVLFALSWRARALNTARVLWQYACIGGAVSWRMRAAVLDSLVQNAVDESGATADEWTRMAGKVIVGIGSHSPFTSSKSEGQGEGDEERDCIATSAASLLTYAPRGPQRQRQWQLAHELLAADMEVPRRFRAVGRLRTVLYKAYKRDCRDQSLPLQRRVKRLVNVPVAEI